MSEMEEEEGFEGFDNKFTYLGNNFYDYNQKYIINTITGKFYEKDALPAAMLFDKSVGNSQFVGAKDKLPDTKGVRFVTANMVKGYHYSKSGKTQYADFLDFFLVNKGNVKKSGDWIEVDNGFEFEKVYILFIECLGYGEYYCLHKREIKKGP